LIKEFNNNLRSDEGIGIFSTRPNTNSMLKFQETISKIITNEIKLSLITGVLPEENINRVNRDINNTNIIDGNNIVGRNSTSTGIVQ
jgi:hypothetical protein